MATAHFFTETPCKALMVPGLAGNAFLSARNFVDTNRLREWKPSNPQLQNTDPQFSYCYINNDSQNGAKDYIMEKLTCDTNSEAFSSPIIEDVFEDSTADKTRAWPMKKCVLKLRNNNLTLQNATNFWNKMGENDCQQISGPINDTNYRLTQERDACVNNSKTLQTQLSMCMKSSADQQLLVTDAQTNYFDTNKNLNTTKTNLVSANERIASLEMMYNQLQHKYNLDVTTLSASNKKNEDELETVNQILEETRKELSLMTTRYNTTSLQLAELGKNYLTLEAAHTSLLDSHKILRERSTTALDALEKCYEEKNSLLVRINQAQAQAALYLALKKSFTECTTERDRLKRLNDTADARIATHRTAADAAEIRVRQCESSRAVLETQAKEMMQRIQQLQKEVEGYNECKIELARTLERYKVTDRRLDVEKNMTDILKGTTNNIHLQVATRLANLISNQVNYVCANSDLANKNIVMQDAVNTATQEIQSILSRYKTMADDCTTISNKLATSKRYGDTVTNQLVGARKEIVILLERISSLQDSYNIIIQANIQLTNYINRYCPSVNGAPTPINCSVSG